MIRMTNQALTEQIVKFVTSISLRALTPGNIQKIKELLDVDVEKRVQIRRTSGLYNTRRNAFKGRRGDDNELNNTGRRSNKSYGRRVLINRRQP